MNANSHRRSQNWNSPARVRPLHHARRQRSVEGLKALPVRAHGPARGNRVGSLGSPKLLQSGIGPRGARRGGRESVPTARQPRAADAGAPSHGGQVPTQGEPRFKEAAGHPGGAGVGRGLRSCVDQLRAGSCVKFSRDGGEIGGGVYRQVGALGKVLAQQPVGAVVPRRGRRRARPVRRARCSSRRNPPRPCT